MTGTRGSSRWCNAIAMGACVWFASCFGAQASDIRVTRDVVWASQAGVSLKADIYQPRVLVGARPGVLMVHGGGWTAGVRQELDFFGRLLAHEGWVAISIDYRLIAPGNGDGDIPLADVRAALQALVQHAPSLGVDTQHLAILGGSAGGHLAAMVAADRPSPLQAAVILWGPTDLTLPFDALTPSQQGMLTTLLGSHYTPERAQQASPAWQVGPGSAPHWLLMHGTQDALVPVAQSRAFAERLRQQGLDAQYLELPGEGHGLQSPAAQHHAATTLLAFLHRVFD